MDRTTNLSPYPEIGSMDNADVNLYEKMIWTDYCCKMYVALRGLIYRCLGRYVAIFLKVVVDVYKTLAHQDDQFSTRLTPLQVLTVQVDVEIKGR